MKNTVKNTALALASVCVLSVSAFAQSVDTGSASYQDFVASFAPIKTSAVQLADQKLSSVQALCNYAKGTFGNSDMVVTSLYTQQGHTQVLTYEAVAHFSCDNYDVALMNEANQKNRDSNANKGISNPHGGR